jgi:hypothetical protein
MNYACDADVTFYEAGARLADKKAMTEMLGPVKNAEQLLRLLNDERSVRTQSYDDETKTARYIVSDGMVVLIFTLVGLNLQQAATVAAECDNILEWGTEAFRQVLARVFGEGSLVTAQ